MCGITERSPLVRLYLLFGTLFMGVLLAQNISYSESPQPSSPLAIVLEIRGAIGPAVSEYISQGIAAAELENADIVVVLMDTPGGLDLAMRDIIQAILNSKVPVATFVSPEGARAASAGTYILYASHVAAMAPATNLGAATPIQIGGLPKPSPQSADDDSEKKQSAPKKQEKSSLEKKIIHDASAYIRSLAEHHGRNVEWAEQAVREAVSLTSQEALDKGVIDVVATDLIDLFEQIDGNSVVMKNGLQNLSTTNISVSHRKPSWKNKILATISDPNIAYLLMLLGMYGLIYELANPGVFLPGVVGIISILIALYGFQVLPVNYSGLALIILGIALITSEAFIPSFGALGIGGIIAFVTGSLILFDEESLKISLPLILSTSLFSAMGILWLMGRLVTFRKQRIRTGSEALVGDCGEVIADFDDTGRIWLMGESWQVTSDHALKRGDKVRVTGKQGLVLRVEKYTEES